MRQAGEQVAVATAVTALENSFRGGAIARVPPTTLVLLPLKKQRPMILPGWAHIPGTEGKQNSGPSHPNEPGGGPAASL